MRRSVTPATLKWEAPPRPPPKGMRAPLRFMTFNLRRDVPHDGAHAWPHRRHAAAEVVRAHRPHVIGTQEGLPHQLAALDADLPAYGRVGAARCGRGEDEACAIFFDATRLRLEASGDLWLSQTPDVPGSASWGSACQRLVTWARLRDRDGGREVRVASTHFDHASEEARRRSARLLAERLDGFVLLGDFNATPGSLVHRALTKRWRDSHDAAARGHDDGLTFHAFTGRARSRIDWVLAPDGAEVLSHTVARDRPWGRLPSDHWAVVADVVRAA